MKKYIQITVVLLFFGALVLFRQLQGNNDQPIVTSPSKNSQSNPTGSGQVSSQQNTSTTTGNTKYKDGTYTGPITDAFYGNVQVQVVVGNGKITDVEFLQAPNDNPTTREVNAQAEPLLRQEAITAQSAQVDIISGASQTSAAFQQSLSGALQQAS